MITEQQNLFAHLYAGEDMPLYRPYNFEGFIGPPRHYETVKPESIESVLADLALRYSNLELEVKAA